MIGHRFRTAILLSCLIVIAGCYTSVHAAFRVDNFVRSANQYLVAGTDLTDDKLPGLSRYDLVVLPAEAQIFNPDVSQKLRALNPDIILLAYVPTVSYNDYYWTDPLHMKLREQFRGSMQLREPTGAQRSIWPGTSAFNIADQGYRDAWLSYAANNVWSSGYWDGIFLDEVASTISWVGAVDLNHDGRAETAAQADRAWRDGYVDLFSRLRATLGPEAILITNGSSEDAFQPYVNGRMFETFPTPWEGAGRWEDSMQRLMANQASNHDPDVFFLSANTNNTGAIDYRQFRFGLASALIAGAFFGYDFGDQNYQTFWDFDEYEAFLGRVVDTPKDLLNAANTRMTPSVWSRDYQAGRAIVNATNSVQTVALGNEFEKLKGTQAPSVNDGRIVTSVTLGPLDGIVLIRPLAELLNKQFSNGSFVRIFTPDGERARTGFFAYTGATVGGDNVVLYDFDDDGAPEIVSATNSQVRIHDSNGNVRYTFYPYGETYTQGINLAVGDFEDDGRIEIVTGTKNGGGPHIRVFNHEGVLINPGFFAFHPLFRGGVNLALGDLNGDGKDEIIAGAGVGGGPQVQIFNKDGRLLTPGFFAYDESIRTGVHVSAGDVTGDGVVDIITGTGYGGPPIIRVFDKEGDQLVREFAAFDVRQRTGVPVAAEDLDGDGIAEIIGLTTDVFTLSSHLDYARTAQIER